MTIRKCNRCSQVLPLDRFYRGQYRCKPCGKEYQREYARANGIPRKRVRDPAHAKVGLKECFRCDKVLQFEEFSPVSRGAQRLAAYCKPCMSDYQLEYRAKDPLFKQRLASYRQTEEWKILHRGQSQRRRSRKKALDTGTVTVAVVRAIYAKTHCHYCQNFIGSEHRTMEHMIPLSRGGLHDAANLTMACSACNSKKQALTETEYRSRNGI